MPDDQPFLREQHPLSNRIALFEDDGRSAWLYLTAAEHPHGIVADTWVYNRADPRDTVDDSDRTSGPPIIRRFAGDGAVVANPSASTWTIRWTNHGESVALLRDETVVAAIVAGRKRGFSAYLNVDGPWGTPLNEEVIRAFDASGD